jgi:hypothetical protein
MTFGMSGGNTSGMEKKLGIGNTSGSGMGYWIGISFGTGDIYNMLRQAME